VANFVETEQIIEHDDVMTSFVQTRGKGIYKKQTCIVVIATNNIFSKRLHI